jgi:hypothetical protein
MTPTSLLPTSKLLLPLLIALASGCSSSDDTGGSDTGNSSGVELSGTDAFDVGSAIGWTRSWDAGIPQILMVFGAWTADCALLDTWEPEDWHFPLLGNGGFVYTRLISDEEPYTGVYDKIEGDPTCYDDETYKTICPRMITTVQWGTISDWDGDGSEADFVEDVHEPKAPTLTLSRIDSDRMEGSFDYDGAVSGTFNIPNCGDGLY